MLLDGLLKGSREHVIERRVVDTSDALCTHEVVQLTCQVIELLSHLIFLLHLSFHFCIGLVARQVFLGPISALFHFFQILLAPVVTVQIPAAPPTSIKLLDDGCTMVEEMGIQALRPL